MNLTQKSLLRSGTSADDGEALLAVGRHVRRARLRPGAGDVSFRSLRVLVDVAEHAHFRHVEALQLDRRLDAVAHDLLDDPEEGIGHREDPYDVGRDAD